MKHRKGYGKLSKPTDQRLALLRSLAREVVKRGKIETTLQRAKEARRVVEKLITLAKEDSLSARRRAFRILQDETLVKRLFEEIAPKMQDREGGYLRITRLGYRRGDHAEIALLSLVE
ncbi:50S ribosomal protein L17 [bacterium]|nr:50S ribosomal protein L17 [bacterium]